MTTPDPNALEQDGPETGTPTPPSKIYVLLDRSGSMSPMVDDVLGGFNNLLAELNRDGSTATMTLVQFDSGDPLDVVADAVPVAEMRPLDRETYVPRGGTPLLDATGRLVNRAAGQRRPGPATHHPGAQSAAAVALQRPDARGRPPRCA